MQLRVITPDPSRDAILRTKSQELEATFLAEMLSYTGMDKQSESFSGGHGEEQFTSFQKVSLENGLSVSYWLSF